MSSSASVAVEFMGVQNTSEANGTVLNGGRYFEFVPGKHLSKLRSMQDLSRIKPQMVQKVLSSIGLSDKNGDFAHRNRQGKGFNGRSEASFIHTEMLELFPVSSGSGFGLNPRVTENKITLPFAIGQTDPDLSGSVPVKSLEEQSTAQLTIFYKGAMNVYDVPAEKVQAIMKLASTNSLSNTRKAKVPCSIKSEEISKSLPSETLIYAADEDQQQRSPVGLEIVRKLSLQRFLQKRKKRFDSVAPYTTMKPATLPCKPEKESDDQIILSLALASSA